MNSIIIGTAGHIDHGKSSLVRALTGTDPDRLIEEQERGMTIDLGFAFMSETIAFIDVPGHERFVKNMVAGVSTVDYAMLVVAADDGVMPQTREHLDILNLLQLKQGLVVINKIDLVDSELLALVEQDVKESIKDTFLEKAPLFKVSAATRQGLAELRSYLETLPEKNTPRIDRGVFWLPVDRSFTMKGFGTVVTGSILSGRTFVGDTLELLPTGRVVKVRGLQSHSQSVTEVGLGHRAAINLQNISREEIQRGDVLATANQFKASHLLDIRLTLLRHAPRPLEQRTRVRVHMGTREVLGRVKLLDEAPLLPGHSTFAQFVLEEPAVAIRRDAFVIRQYSPALTIGGGVILETNPSPHRRHDAAILQQLTGLEKQNPVELVMNSLISHADELATMANLSKWSGLDENSLSQLLISLQAEKSIQKIETAGKILYLAQSILDQIKNKLTSILVAFHEKEPLRPGMNRAELRLSAGPSMEQKLFEMALHELKTDGLIEEHPGWVRLTHYRIRLSPPDEQTASAIIKIWEAQPFAPLNEKECAGLLKKPEAEIRRILGALQGMGRVLRLEGDLYFTKEALRDMENRLLKFSEQNQEISVGQFRELLSTSRKFAVPLLGYLDQKGITERVGDGRTINRQVLQKQEQV